MLSKFQIHVHMHTSKYSNRMEIIFQVPLPVDMTNICSLVFFLFLSFIFYLTYLTELFSQKDCDLLYFVLQLEAREGKVLK